MDTLAFGYILPTTGRIPDFHRLETCAAGRTTLTVTSTLRAPITVFHQKNYRCPHFLSFYREYAKLSFSPTAYLEDTVYITKI